MNYNKKEVQKILNEKYSDKYLYVSGILEDLDIISRHEDSVDGSYFEIIQTDHADKVVLEGKEVVLTEAGLKYIIDYLDDLVKYQKELDDTGH